MAVHDSRNVPFDELSFLGVAVCEVDADQIHVGFLYKLDDGEVRLCHFARHFALRDHPPSPNYLWQNMGLDETSRHFVAAYVANYRINPANIPFGIDPGGACFDSVTGDFIRPPLGKGLTCATFIIAILKANGFSLLIENQWPNRPDDDEWQEKILRVLAEHCDDPEHFEAAERDIGAKRYRPEEVAGAATLEAWPVEFNDARSVANEILRDISNANAAS
jgi:hypothetical protein